MTLSLAERNALALIIKQPRHPDQFLGMARITVTALHARGLVWNIQGNLHASDEGKARLRADRKRGQSSMPR